MVKLPVHSTTRSLLRAGTLFSFMIFMSCAAQAGFTQNATTQQQMANRIRQLENQIQTLSRTVYRGESPPPATALNNVAPAAGDPSALRVYESRISALEQENRRLTGQIEQLSHQTRTLQNRLDKMQRDYEARLSALEGGGQANHNTNVGYNAHVLTPQESTATLVGNPQIVNNAASSQTLGTLSNGSRSGPDALYEDAFADIRNAKYKIAEKKFRDFIAAYPTHRLAGNAQYWLAETYYVRGEFSEAAKLFAKGYQDYPKGNKAADNLLKLGLSLSRLDRKEDACLSFTQLQKEFPNDTSPASRRAVREMKRLGCS